VGLDPGEEVSDFREDTGLTLTGSSSPRYNTDDIVLARLGLGWADEGAAGITHARGLAVSPESDHAGLDHVGPTGLQVGVSPNLALELLELVRHVAGRSDETPAGKPASCGAVVVIPGVGHASGTGIGGREINILGQLDQSDVVLHRVGFVEFRVDDDLGNGDIFFGAVIVLLVPFSDADGKFGGALRLSETVSGTENPAGGDQSTSANVLFLEEGPRSESE